MSQPDNALSITAFVFTLQACLFSGLTGLLSGPIARWDALDVRDVVWACVAVAAVGTLLGALSHTRRLGRISCWAGTAVLVALISFGLM